jgi:omega-6 fatty acid desaturase (delta-12 desaturase)
MCGFMSIYIIITVITVLIGWKSLLLIFMPMILGASILGVWLFYIQHQLRSVYWTQNSGWDQFRASMEGSSFYKRPSFFRWFIGNIGNHHIHHLAPRIPNYKLNVCFEEVSALQEINPVPYLSGLRNICLSLWDEQSGLLVSFGEAKAIIKTSELNS